MAKRSINILTYDIGWRFKDLGNSTDKYIKLYNKYRDTGKPEYVKEALVIYKNPLYKLYLECMLLSGFSDKECIEFFGCDVIVIDFYKKIFFDIDPVKHSRAKLLMIAKDGKPNEINLKLCSVTLGKQYTRYHVGLDSELNEDFIRNMRKRISDGMIIKSLGHELTGSTTQEMNAYMKIIKLVKQEESDERKVKNNASLSDLVDHFTEVFDD